LNSEEGTQVVVWRWVIVWREKKTVVSGECVCGFGFDNHLLELKRLMHVNIKCDVLNYTKEGIFYTLLPLFLTTLSWSLDLNLGETRRKVRIRIFFRRRAFGLLLSMGHGLGDGLLTVRESRLANMLGKRL
jgi:hypothetical protein